MEDTRVEQMSIELMIKDTQSHFYILVFENVFSYDNKDAFGIKLPVGVLLNNEIKPIMIWDLVTT